MQPHDPNKKNGDELLDEHIISIKQTLGRERREEEGRGEGKGEREGLEGENGAGATKPQDGLTATLWCSLASSNIYKSFCRFA